MQTGYFDKKTEAQLKNTLHDQLKKIRERIIAPKYSSAKRKLGEESASAARWDGGSGCEFMVASHNQASVEHVLASMLALGLAPQSHDSGVYFGQLLGMSDNLTFLLGQNGYRAYKYVPFGPVDEVIPYLVRRAQENAAVLGGSGHGEIGMLRSELARRANPFAK